MTSEARADRPWCEYQRDKPISATQLADILRRFKVAPTKWREGTETIRGYRLADLQPVFDRYLPSQPATAATSLPDSDLDCDTIRHTATHVANKEPPVSACEIRDVAAVAAVGDAEIRETSIDVGPALVVLARGRLLRWEKDQDGLLRLVSCGTGHCYAVAVGTLENQDIEQQLLDSLPLDAQLRQEVRYLLTQASQASQAVG